MADTKVVETGDTVQFSFVGKFEDGSIFDTSDEPLSVKIGTGKLIQGLDKGIMGMKEGEEKEIKISPEEGYGFEDSNLIARIPHEIFKKNNLEPQVGMMLRTSQGDCYVSKLSDEDVEINYNHPLAGKNIIFDVKVERIVKE